MLVANESGLIDDEGFRNPVHAVVDAYASVCIRCRDDISVAIAFEPSNRFVAFILVIEAYNRDASCQICNDWVLLKTGITPRGPDVQQPNLAFHLFRGERLLR